MKTLELNQMETIQGGAIGAGCVIAAGSAAVAVGAIALSIVATGGLAAVGILGAMALQWSAIGTGLAVGGAAGTCAYEATH